ncbi:hypothetical protein DFH28DRAFT_928064 [Melampsora americana]|nr:hypothetical protein DFH28DRAFT_928064 [Melampsora americana]
MASKLYVTLARDLITDEHYKIAEPMTAFEHEKSPRWCQKRLEAHLTLVRETFHRTGGGPAGDQGAAHSGARSSARAQESVVDNQQGFQVSQSKAKVRLDRGCWTRPRSVKSLAPTPRATSMGFVWRNPGRSKIQLGVESTYAINKPEQTQSASLRLCQKSILLSSELLRVRREARCTFIDIVELSQVQNLFSEVTATSHRALKNEPIKKVTRIEKLELWYLLIAAVRMFFQLETNFAHQVGD